MWSHRFRLCSFNLSNNIVSDCVCQDKFERQVTFEEHDADFERFYQGNKIRIRRKDDSLPFDQSKTSLSVFDDCQNI